MVWVETPTNPLLKLADLAAIAAIARRHNVISVADNTFASPVIHRPLESGFDIVVHSATKYLNGHSDVVAGLAVVGDNKAGGQAGLPAKRGGRRTGSVQQFPDAARYSHARCGWKSTAPTRWRLRNGWSSTRWSKKCSIPDWNRIRSISLPARRWRCPAG
jgi:aspartate aminotransferase-like enzyme